MDALAVRDTRLGPLHGRDLPSVVELDAARAQHTRRDYFERRLAAARREPDLHIQFAATDSRGLAGYLAAGAGCLWSYRNATYCLDLDGTVSIDECFLVAFANGRQYGNGFVLAADGNPSDGWLDAVVIGRGSTLHQIWRGRSFLLKKMVPVDGVLRVRVRQATVSGTSLRAHVDGEPFRPASPVTVRVEAGVIRLAAATRPAASG